MSPVPCQGGGIPYVIKAGDTCYALARRYNISVQAIQNRNPGLNCNNLQVGQTICIPGMAPSTMHSPAGSQPYTIRAGDTYYAWPAGSTPPCMPSRR
jgi:LysM repeat protein